MLVLVPSNAKVSKYGRHYLFYSQNSLKALEFPVSTDTRAFELPLF